MLDPDNNVTEANEMNNSTSLALFRPNLRITRLEIVAVSGTVHEVSAGTSTVATVEFDDSEFFSNHVANLTVSVDPSNSIAESSESDTTHTAEDGGFYSIDVQLQN